MTVCRSKKCRGVDVIPLRGQCPWCGQQLEQPRTHQPIPELELPLYMTTLYHLTTSKEAS